MKTLKQSALSVLFVAGCAGSQTPAEPPPKAAAPAPAPVAQPKKEVNHQAAGDEAFVAGNYEEALKHYDALLTKEATNKVARYNRAVTLQHLGKDADAEKVYREILAEEPTHEEATLNLGAIMRRQDKLDEAIKLYEGFLKADAYNSRVLNNLAALYRLKKDYGQAVKLVRKLLMRDQKNVEAYKNLALVYFDQKKFKLTQTILSNALKMAEEKKLKDPDIHVNFGLTHLALGDNGKAMASFKEAVALSPEHGVANFNIGALALAHRDYNLAAKSFEAASKSWPSDYELVKSLGYAYQGQQRYEDSAKLLEKALTMKESEEVLTQLMVVFQAANKPDDALRYGDRLLKLNGKSCGEQDFDGLCGRIKGIQMMKQMAQQAPPAEDKPKATGVDIFKEEAEPEAPAEGQPPADGQAPPADGQAPPAEGQAPPAAGTAGSP